MKRNQGSRYKRIHLLPMLCLCALLIGFLAPAARAAEGKTVRVGYMLMDNFEENETVQLGSTEAAIRSGYGYDYLQMLRYYTGWEYEYVEGTWQELLDMLEQGEIDLLTHVAKNPQREETMLFSTEPQAWETHYLFVDGPSQSIDPDNLMTLNGKNIGVIQGDFRTWMFQQWCDERGIQCNIKEYQDVEQIHTALHSGEIHATSASNVAVSSYQEGKWRAIVRFEDTPSYIAVKRGAEGEALLAEVNEAQSRILSVYPNYGQELMQKYKRNLSAERPVLSKEEEDWLDGRGRLTIGYQDDRRPLAYTDEHGKLAGLLADVLYAMETEYGMQFQAVPYQDGMSLLNALRDGSVDIIAPVGFTMGMAEVYDLAMTNPITVETMVAVYKSNKTSQQKDIFHKIAVLENSVSEKSYAKRCYPQAKWVLAQSMEDAFEMVERGDAGSYLLRFSTWSWYKNEYPLLDDLEVVTLPDNDDVSMAIRMSDSDLLPILNKGISLLSQADVNLSLVSHSDVRGELTLLTLMRDHPVTTAIGILATMLFVGLLFVLYRLNTEKRYMQELEIANRKAESARWDAERANLAKSTFLTSMSHDIRTPMNAIVGMTTLAAKHLNDPEYVRNCLSKVNLASDHLLTLINDVLDINKIESGNLSLTPSVFSLADSIMNLANIGRHQLREKNHHFEVRVHNIKQEYLFADELRINQVFINLLSNAVKYTPANGRITVDVKQEPVSGERNKVRLIYEITDTGIGMSEEFQAHMYDLFAMANKSSRTITGSGVGLSICKQLVELMEGSIVCESAEGKGTKFTVTLELPVADRAVDHLMLPPMKILLVDDDEIFLATAADILRELGVSPDCVDSGEAALRAVREKHAQNKDYPVIIIDWQMPEMDGIETTRRIRAQVGPDVSIIIISAYAPEDIRDAALAAGANSFINKPFFRSTAYQSISEILGLNLPNTVDTSDPHWKVRGMNLLIAEDNDLNWEIIHELLAMYEITARRAENGQECLHILEQSVPGEYACVLMDIQMPVMNGYEAASAIRRMERGDLCAIPIIAMTADAYTEDVVRCAAVGMNGHIPKPIDMERLLQALGELNSH